MDRFPEAFRRFEKLVDTDRIRSFIQLKMAFSYWAGRNWKDTRLQNEALKVEAERRGIPVSRQTDSKPRTWKHEFVSVRGKPQSRYRELKTGRFIKKPFG
jgi:hypothetical protein